MYRIKNTADDRQKALLHRTASKFATEPDLGGRRIRLGTSIEITDEHFARVKPVLDEWVKNGMVEYELIGAEKEPAEKDGPTLEGWVQAGYAPEDYAATPVGELHPWGFRVKSSAGLTKFLQEQEAIQAAEVQKAKEAEEFAALERAEAERVAAQAEADRLAVEAEQQKVAHEAASVVDAPAPSPVPDQAPVVEEKTADKKSSSKKSNLR